VPEQYNMIVRMIELGVPVKLRVNVQTKFLTDDKNGYNLLAELPGTDLKDETVMIGAHIDSWHSSTGATDNADGSAVVLEAMRIPKSGRRKTASDHSHGALERRGRGAFSDPRGMLRNISVVTANKSAREKFYAYFNLDPGSGPIYGWYLENNPALAADIRRLA
jgi:hypothetical protein